MALENFIPEIWSDRILEASETALVYGQDGVINTDYEGEIQAYGDTVRITSIGDPTIVDYAKGGTLPDPEELTDAQLSLIINQSKAFNFKVDDIDRAQQNPKVMSEAMQRAGYAVSKVADTYLASLYTEVASGNLIGTDGSPITPTAATAYEYLVDMSVKMDEADVPEEGRWAIVPAWFHGLLLKDDRFVKYGTAPQDERLRNGAVGQAAGIRILKSNNVPNTAATKYKILGGHRMAWSWAQQIRKVEAYRPEKSFSDAVKGLHLYGAKVLRPDKLVLLTANKS